MKILIPRVIKHIPDESDPSKFSTQVESQQITFNEIAQGHHVGLVPIQYKLDDTVFAEKLVKIQVDAEASDNNRGARRIMLKVSLPYGRAMLDNTGTKYVLDTASSGTITAHVVLSVPSRLRADLLEQNDVTVSRIASSNVALAMRLLGVLTSIATPTASIADPADESGAKLDELSDTAPDRVVVDGPVTTVDGGSYVAMDITSGGGGRDTVNGFRSKTFGADGMSVSARPTGQGIVAAARDPIMRGLYGLVPIEENSLIVQRTAVRKGA
jgi:hypothetical protein